VKIEGKFASAERPAGNGFESIRWPRPSSGGVRARRGRAFDLRHHDFPGFRQSREVYAAIAISMSQTATSKNLPVVTKLIAISTSQTMAT